MICKNNNNNKKKTNHSTLKFFRIHLSVQVSRNTSTWSGPVSSHFIWQPLSGGKHTVREMVLLSSLPSALTTDVPWYEISYINLSRQIKAMRGKKAVTTEAS